MELVAGGGNSSGQIWIENHPDLGWCPGRVDGLGANGKFIVTDEQGTNFEVAQDKARQVDGNCLKGVDDLLDLGDFNEGALLHNIRVRYFKDDIYTGIGNPILISLNPYQQFASLYGAAKMKFYKDRGASISTGDAKFPPHLFSVGAASFGAMIGDSKNQSIIISGESGAGKTEATKRILTYFANLQSDQSKGPSSKDTTTNIEEQVLRSNPILEAFGNAKTIRNDNSSRFGKYIDIEFDMDGKLRSAKISNYLLEKCRIVTQQPDERGYHAFYQLCAGAQTMSLNSLLALRDASDHAYTCGCTRIVNVDDEEDYNEMVECMASLGFSVEEKHDVFKIVAAVLHLGDMEFEEHPEKGHGTRISTPGAAERISEILGVQTADFIKVFQYKTLEDPLTRNIINTEQDVQSSSNTRHSMAKVAYSRLFDWLVWRINQATSAKGGSKDTRNIGILDIYGFEVFEWNSFEQLCINFANEKLQQHFNSHMFTLEQQLYTDEGITWSHIQWQDNREIIDSLDRKHVGLFQIVDSECLMPNATDVTCLSKVRSSFKNSKIVYQPTRFASTNFAVAHYAGEVIYDILSFLEKNTDKLHADIINLLKSSSSSLVKKLFTDPLFAPEQAQAAAPARGAGGVARRTTAAMGRGSADTGRAKQNVTVSMMFRQQLDQLVEDLNKTHPRYIRCIKPNAHKRPHEFDSLDVQRQLRCAGMLESIRIRRAGYSVRRPFKEFYNRFRVLCPNIIGSKGRDPDFKELSRQILQTMEAKLRADKVALEDKMWQIGRSKVFLKEDLQAHLEGRIAAAVSKFVVRVQKRYRGFSARKRYKAMKAAALVAQAQLRTFVAVKAFRDAQMRYHATVALQAALRMAGPRRLWLRRANGIRKMQALARGFLTRRKIGRLKGKKAEERIAKMREEEERAKALEAAKQAAEEQKKAMEEMQRQMAAEREKAQEEARRQLDEERAKLKQEEAAREAKLAEQARAAEEANKAENMRHELLESRKEVARLQAQLESAPAISPASAAMEAELEAIRREVQDLRRDKVKLEVELATAKSSEEYESLVAEMNTLREECSSLRRANFDMELQQEQNSAQLDAWQKQAQRAEDSIRELSTLKVAHDEMQVEMHKVQAQKAAMEDRLQNDEATRTELRDLRVEKMRLTGDLETSKMREEAMAEKLKAAEKVSLELQQQRQRTMTMEAELDASRKQVDRFRTQVTELSTTAKDSRAESLESMRTELLSKFEPRPRSSLGGPGTLLPPAEEMAGEMGRDTMGYGSEGRSTIVNQRAMLEKLRQQFSSAAQAPQVEEVAVPDSSSAREEELEELLAKAKKENVELSIKIANLQDELSRENSEGSSLLERSSQMQAELSDLKFQLETETQSSRRLGAENAGLQEQIAMNENELKSLRRRVASAEESSVRFEEEAKVAHSKLARLKDEQEAFDQHARQLQKQASDALAREQGARAELDSLQQLVEHHRIAAETAERMRIEGESSARWLDSENERLKAELEGEKNERVKIKQVVDELVAADGMGRKEEMQREIDKWRARAAHLERESKEAKALNNEMTKLMSQMTQAVSERSDDTSNIHRQNASLVKQIEAKTQELRTARLEKEEIQSRYDNLQSTGTYFQDKYKEACSELRTLKQEHSISTAAASKLKLRVESLQKETEELRDQCARLSLEAKSGPSLDDASRLERYESTMRDLEQRIRSKDEETRSKEAFIAKSQAVNDCLNTLLVLESEQTALYEESIPLHDENLRKQITAKKDKANHVIGRLNEIMNEDERPSISFLRR